MSETLKPCPFCGGPAHLDTVGKGGSRHAAVFCDDILCPGDAHGVGAGIDNQRRSAVAAWNRRADDARIASLETRLAEAREHIRKQAEDIMTLGGMVYDNSDPPVAWKDRAAEVERLRKALEKVRRLVCYPVSREIDPRGYGIYVAPDAPDFIVEVIDATLQGGNDAE